MAKKYVRDAIGRFASTDAGRKADTGRTAEQKAARERAIRQAKTAAIVAGVVVGAGLAGGGIKVSRISDEALIRHARRAANAR